jgi:hypothetical protein
MKVARRVRTGTMSVNGAFFLAPNAPFGGYKQSGIGRESGVEGFEEYLETKTIAVPVDYPTRLDAVRGAGTRPLACHREADVRSERAVSRRHRDSGTPAVQNSTSLSCQLPAKSARRMPSPKTSAPQPASLPPPRQFCRSCGSKHLEMGEAVGTIQWFNCQACGYMWTQPTRKT